MVTTTKTKKKRIGVKISVIKTVVLTSVQGFVGIFRTAIGVG
jgi:hypothetical protein